MPVTSVQQRTALDGTSVVEALVHVSPEYLKASGGDRLAQLVEIGMLLEGVHLFHAGGFFSTAHTAQDVERTVAAFDTVLSRLEVEESFA